MTPSPKADAGLRRWIPDLLTLFALLAFWAVAVRPIVVTEARYSYDVLRDSAAAINIQHGRILSDPAYCGLPIWYPPLSPMIVAALSSAFDVAPLEVYRWSQLFVNWLIPAGCFFCVRLAWGRIAGWGAMVALVLAVPWWQREVAHGAPAIHAVIWGWAALLLYAWQHRARSIRAALTCGLFLGISFWHHPFIPTTLAVVFALEAVWQYSNARRNGESGQSIKRVVIRSALLLAAAFAVAAPLLFLLFEGPVLNPEPREYLAAELKQADVALMAPSIPHAVWVWGMGIVGIACAIRQRTVGGRLLPLVLLVSLLGQFPGYARIFDWPGAAGLPTLVPHEFQRIFQIGWGVAIGIGIASVARALANRTKLREWGRFGVIDLAAIAFLITAWDGLHDLDDNLRHYLRPSRTTPDQIAAADWIRENTNIDDVFLCEPEVAFFWLNAETGRKVWVTGRGYGNPRVDWHERVRFLIRLRDETSPEAFCRQAREAGIAYFIPTAKWTPKVLAGDGSLDHHKSPYWRRVVGEAGGMEVFQLLP